MGRLPTGPNRFIGICLVGLFLSPLAADENVPGLSVLLTNDDGYDSVGIKALDSALRAAGHDVTVVAPLGQRSGSGMKITLGELDIVEQSRGVWSVDASPADAVAIGLKYVMREARPDVVVSGANFGQNLGSNAMMSGTVGAAMMAVLEGVPAIAISVGIDLDEARAEPDHFPSTIAAFPAAAAFTVSVVNALASTGTNGLLPSGHMVNINYPALASDKIESARWARASSYGGFSLIYPTFENGKIRSWIEPDARGQTDGDNDTALFARGHITVSVLTPDWNVEAHDGEKLRARVGGLVASPVD